MKKTIAILFFSLAVSIPVILPFFHSGYFPTHDGEWAVVRLTDMFRTLRDFQIPPRYSGNLNFGYGYPLFNFTYPSPYYIGVLVHFLGTGFVDTIKILFSASVLFSGFFMFFASRVLWKNTLAGIISAIAYVYFPYRMVDLYVRGSIGESLSFALFPLLFYLAIKLISKPSFLLVGSIGICVAALIMTHNIMTVLFMPLYILFILIQAIFKNKKAIKAFFLSVFLGFGLSAFFSLPALFEKNNILLSQIPIADRNLYFVTLEQLILPRWGYSVPIDPNGFSYQLGLVHLTVFIIIVLSLFSFLIKNKKKFKEYYIKLVGILTICAAFFAFLLFKPSEILWKNLPFLSEINYPWIVLGILGFLVSLLAGFLCKQSFGKYFMIALAVITVVITLPYAKPEYYFNKGDDYYLTNDATTTSSNELMPLWVKEKQTKRFVEKVEIVGGAGTINNLYYDSKKIAFDVLAEQSVKVRVNTIYYPGWKAYVDKKSTNISYANDKGVMEIIVPSGRHVVEVGFGETPIRLVSDIISIASFFSILAVSAASYRRRLLRL